MNPAPDVMASYREHIRLTFAAFLLTFVIARVLVFLIMAHRLPDLYLHLGGTHVHHLNYGIFMLVAVCAYLLFAPISGRGRTWASLGYGVGLGLTFDEFGMWLHLGGGYWQRANFDAIIVMAALLGTLALAPPLRAWRGRHIATAAIAAGAAAIFYLMLLQSFHFAVRMEERLAPLERQGPT